MAEAKIAQRGPYAVDVEGGKTYYWCRCGLSHRQPFCDGSHKGGPLVPLAHKADSAGKVLLCGCKRTQTPPKCDGSHTRL